MKRIISIILTVIAALLIPYLGISFVLWELNPKAWTIFERLLVIIFSTAAPFMVVLVDMELKDKK